MKAPLKEFKQNLQNIQKWVLNNSVNSVYSVQKHSRQFASFAGKSAGFSLVIALVMVALMAVITVAVMTTVSLERGTARSYSSRYEADLAAQNGLQAAAKTLAASPNGTSPVTGKDTFLVVRANGPAENGITPTYYYLAQPSTGTSPTITYYPLFSA